MDFPSRGGGGGGSTPSHYIQQKSGEGTRKLYK